MEGTQVKPVDCQQLYSDGRHYDLQTRDVVEDISFYLRQARKYGEPVLELACGTGRITIPLAEQGIKITGLDVSEPMLSQARKKAAEKGVTVEWVQADCRDFKLDKKFRLVFLPFNSITHLHDLESIEACFSRVGRHLARDGRFIIDVFVPAMGILMRDPSKRYPVAEYPDPDGKGTVTITESNVYDSAAQMNRIKWYYSIGGGKEFVKENNMRMFFPQELVALLKYNGFVIENKFADYGEAPFSSDSGKQLVICHRRD
jgi:SAM-dependent methyltransferase